MERKKVGTNVCLVVLTWKCEKLQTMQSARLSIGDFTEEIVHQPEKIENVRSQHPLWRPLLAIRTDGPASTSFLSCSSMETRQRRSTVFLRTMKLNYYSSLSGKRILFSGMKFMHGAEVPEISSKNFLVTDLYYAWVGGFFVFLVFFVTLFPFRKTEVFKRIV